MSRATMGDRSMIDQQRGGERLHLSRRWLVLGAGALAACGAEPPARASVTVSGRPGMNPAPGGGDAPVTVSIIELRRGDAFDAANALTLRNPEAALAPDYLGRTLVTVVAGGTASRELIVNEDATVLGLFADFQNPTLRAFRASIGVARGQRYAVRAILGPDGLRLGSG
ncbi:MAG: type VI secretion system lipoprotein TssJ [Pseudomonadota bacterium]